jgi:crotonobetainyl-CoA:carnitine CoA-transferase CaiB-like acyl-CoA transferase
MRTKCTYVSFSQQLIRQLAAKCDVVVENFKAGGLAKYGLDYASLKQVNPCTPTLPAQPRILGATHANARTQTTLSPHTQHTHTLGRTHAHTRRLAIIYCSITGFGQTGPRKDQAGYDFLLQGMSGLMSITGDPQGHPMKVGVAIVDIMTGLYATSSILAALLERDAQPEGKREGQHIDLSLFDVSVAFLANQVGIIYSFLFIFIFLQ